MDVYHTERPGGFTVASKVNSNSIFLPILGVRWSDYLQIGSAGYYWSSTLRTDAPSNAYNLEFTYSNNYGNYITVSNMARSYGMQIRPVRASK